jgi:hypothetical protein
LQILFEGRDLLFQQGWVRKLKKREVKKLLAQKATTPEKQGRA